MPHAAFYVVQHAEILPSCCEGGFQCRTQHFMWCNLRQHSRIAVLLVSMPHAAFYVVQHRDHIWHCRSPRFQCRTQHFMWCNLDDYEEQYEVDWFQCRTQHFMWCNSVARSPCPARGERAFWKVVDFLCHFPLMGRHFHRKIAASIGVFPCAAQGCAKMENRDGRMRLCGIAVAFSTFLHHVCIIAENP